MEAIERLIVPFDVTGIPAGKELANSLTGTGIRYAKAGYEFCYSAGEGPADASHALHVWGFEVFVDLKLHDIPTTMRKGARALVEQCHPWAINVHAAAGIESMRAAVEGAKSADPNVKVWAVTLLTSTDMPEAEYIDKVMQRTQVAAAAGCDGVICGPMAVAAVRTWGGMGDIVCPGIRPSWASTDDQKQIGTPGQAVYDGADYLVIGRPIISPPEKIVIVGGDGEGDTIDGTPANAVKLICEEIDA